METKKRIAIIKKEGMTMKMEYSYLTDVEFEKSLAEVSKKMNVSPDSILTYTLGTQEEMEDGMMYFCPRCGEYNEYGYEPELHLYYRTEGDVSGPAGYFKDVQVNCTSCDDTFRLTNQKMEDEAQALSAALK